MKKTNFSNLIKTFEDTIFNVINLKTTRFKVNKRIEFNHRKEVLEVEEAYNLDQSINTYNYELYQKVEDNKPVYLIFRFTYNSNEINENKRYKWQLGKVDGERYEVSHKVYEERVNNQLRTLPQIIEAIHMLFHFSYFEKRYEEVQLLKELTKEILDKNNQKNSKPILENEPKEIREPEKNAMKLWEKVTKKLETKVSRPSYETWIKSAKGFKFTAHNLYVNTPNEFARDWLEARYTNLISSIVYELVEEELNVVFTTNFKIPS